MMEWWPNDDQIMTKWWQNDDGMMTKLRQIQRCGDPLQPLRKAPLKSDSPPPPPKKKFFPLKEERKKMPPLKLGWVFVLKKPPSPHPCDCVQSPIWITHGRFSEGDFSLLFHKFQKVKDTKRIIKVMFPQWVFIWLFPRTMSHKKVRCVV